jgi:hypothetical protein
MEERVFSIYEYCSGIWTIKALCKEFGTLRPLGYKYVLRYQQYGVERLLNNSRRPHDIPNITPLSIERMIISFRRKRPRYGVQKILVKLTERFPDKAFLSVPAIIKFYPKMAS